MSAVETVPFAALGGLEGRVFEGDSFSFSAAEQEEFERVTWVDRAYPDPDPPEFPERIVEGFHALSMLDALQRSCFRPDPEQSYGYNYGLDRVRFVAPILIDEELRPRFEVTSAARRGEGFLLKLSCSLGAADSAEPKMVADWLVLILPRQGFELS